MKRNFDYFRLDDRGSKASLSAWDALADSISHPRSNSVSSMLRSQNSAGTSPTEVNRNGASPSNRKAPVALHQVHRHNRMEATITSMQLPSYRHGRR